MRGLFALSALVPLFGPLPARFAFDDQAAITQAGTKRISIRLERDKARFYGGAA